MKQKQGETLAELANIMIKLARIAYQDAWFGLVSLFNGISTLFRLFNAKPYLLEEQYWYYLTHSWEDKGVHTFPKGICPKVNWSTNSRTTIP